MMLLLDIDTCRKELFDMGVLYYDNNIVRKRNTGSSYNYVEKYNRLLAISIIKHTQFLNSFKNHGSFAERVFCIYKNIVEIPLCPVCGKIVNYRQFSYNTTCSLKCMSNSFEIKEKKKITTFKNYGVDNPSKSDEIKNKKIITTFSHYGVENPFQSESIKNTIKNKYLTKYGVEYYTVTQEYKDKIQKISLEKWGVNHFLQSKEIILKRKKTNLLNYGVENSFQREDVKNKIKQTIFNRYGLLYYSQTEEYKNKVKITCLDKYGVEYITKSSIMREKTRQTNLMKYGVPYISQALHIKEKVKQTNLLRYGCEYPQQNLEIRKKVNSTNLLRYGIPYACLINGGYSKVSQKLFWMIYNKLPDNLKNKCYFQELNGEYNRYNSTNHKVYLYDFVLSSIKIVIEFNGEYWHRNPLYYKTTKENMRIWEHDKIKNDFIKSCGFDLIIIWENTFYENENKIVDSCLKIINIKNEQILKIKNEVGA